MPRRNPDATRARILAAAEELFAAAGFAGTRIDAVAARAGANKRMIYHYFGGKEALFEAVLRHCLADSPWAGENEIPADAARLIAWEGLEWNEPVGGADRAQAIGGLVRTLEARLGEGRGPVDVDPALLALVLVSARLFPLVAPHFAALIAGERGDFGARYQSLLRDLVDALAARSRAAKPRITLKPSLSDHRFASDANTSK